MGSSRKKLQNLNYIKATRKYSFSNDYAAEILANQANGITHFVKKNRKQNRW
jgi:hypothetical protein